MTSRNSSSSNRSIDMLEEYKIALNTGNDRSMQFCMEEEPLEPMLRKGNSLNDRKEKASETCADPRWTPITPSDIEYLKFLNFNTAQRSDQKFDFEINEKKPPTSSSNSSDYEDYRTKRSRSKEKRRFTEKVTGDDLRKLFGEMEDSTWVEPRRTDSNSLQHLESTNVTSLTRIENEIPNSYSTATKKTPDFKVHSNQLSAHCSCNKTKCLKMYCSCFSNGVPCGPQCECKECRNTPEMHETLAIEQSLPQVKQESCCSCKMTYCEKNYCTCSRNQHGCSKLCTCYSCKNVFGVKPKK